MPEDAKQRSPPDPQDQTLALVAEEEARIASARDGWRSRPHGLIDALSEVFSAGYLSGDNFECVYCGGKPGPDDFRVHVADDETGEPCAVGVLEDAVRKRNEEVGYLGW